MKKQILAMMLALGPQGPAIAGFAEGLAAYNAHQDARALKEIAPLAKAGNADAQHLLGLMYYTGRGVPRDHAQAFRWHYQAALQGKAAAEYVVGAMYYAGNAVPKDEATAVSWFRKAAEQGNPDAQYALGLMVRYHVAGLPEDLVLAWVLWDRAAASGHRNARQQLVDLARRMTDNQIAQAQRLSRSWQPGMPLPIHTHTTRP